MGLLFGRSAYFCELKAADREAKETVPVNNNAFQKRRQIDCKGLGAAPKTHKARGNLKLQIQIGIKFI